MTQPEMTANQPNALQIAKARDLMNEAMELLDNVGASLSAIYLDQAIAALASDPDGAATKR